MVRLEGPGFPEEVRRFWAEIYGQEYIAYDSLEQAKRDPDGVIVLSGDYGTTVLLTAPAHLVRCDTETLVTLVSDLDAVSWMSGDPAIATVAFERHPVGTSIEGGWGGGIVADGVWTNPQRLSAENAPRPSRPCWGDAGASTATCCDGIETLNSPANAHREPWHGATGCPGTSTSHHPQCRSPTDTALFSAMPAVTEPFVWETVHVSWQWACSRAARSNFDCHGGREWTWEYCDSCAPDE